MDEVSQKGRRKCHQWTAKDQALAEVAAACGVSFKQIATAIGCSDRTVPYRLIAQKASAKRAKNIDWQQQNQERYKSAIQKWKQENRSHSRSVNRQWYENNREAKRAQNCKWRLQNKDRHRLMIRRWMHQNGDRQRSVAKEWRQSNRELLAHKSKRRRSLIRQGRSSSLLPATRSAIDARFAIWRNRCAFCGVDAKHLRNLGYRRLTEDHAMAVTSGGLDEAANIMPACATCNCSKNDSPLATWYRAQPFFTEARWRKIQRHCPAAVVGQLPLAFAA